MSSQSEPSEPTTVRIRRAPKVAVFLFAGAALGLIAALTLTSIFEVDPAVGFTATFGYLALYLIPIGVLISGLLAVVLDRRASKRERRVTAVREQSGD